MSLGAIAETLAEQTLLETVVNILVGGAVISFFLLYAGEFLEFMIYGSLIIVLVTAPLIIFAPFLLASPLFLLAPILLIGFGIWVLTRFI